MSEVIGKFVEALGWPFWLIGMFALLAGALAHHFAAADLEDSGGRAKLREALEAGGGLRRLYIRLLTPALDRLDRFLGDSDKAAFSLSSPFRNREPHPYWTAWSFDRCALLALFYPLLSLFAVWACTGESESTAEWLGMQHGALSPRLISAATIILITIAFWRSRHTIAIISTIAFAVAGAIAGTHTVASAVTDSRVVTGAVAGAVAVASAVAIAVVPVALAVAPVLALLLALSVALTRFRLRLWSVTLSPPLALTAALIRPFSLPLLLFLLLLPSTSFSLSLLF
jgi:hypothetical protein